MIKKKEYVTISKKDITQIIKRMTTTNQSQNNTNNNPSHDNNNLNHKEKNDEWYYYQLPRIDQINNFNITQLKWKASKLNEDSANNRFDKTDPSFAKAINTQQHIDCNGSTNSNENNDIDIAKRDKNSNGIRNERIRSSSTNTTPNRSVVAKSPSVNENSHDNSNDNVNKNEATSTRQAVIDMHCYRDLFVQSSSVLPACGETTINIANTMLEWSVHLIFRPTVFKQKKKNKNNKAINENEQNKR